MRVDVEKWIVKDKNRLGDLILSYKVVNKEFCCDGIKSLPINLHYTVPEYTVDDFYNKTDDIDNDDYTLGIMLEELYTWYDGEDTQEDTKYHMISFCPKCGKNIEVNVVREIDKTEEYNNLRKQYDVIHKQWMKCDSKKRSDELEKQWREINNVINGFYETDKIKMTESN